MNNSAELFSQLDPTSAQEYQNVPIFQTSSARISYNVFPPNTRVPGHIHPRHDQIVCLLAGTLVAHIRDTKLTLRHGEVVIVEANEPHWFETSDDTAVALSVLSGALQDSTTITTLAPEIMNLLTGDALAVLESGALTEPRECARRAELPEAEHWNFQWASDNLCASTARAVVCATRADVSVE